MRRAVIEIVPEALADCVGVIVDAGLTIETSLSGFGAVVLGLSGDALPIDCEVDGCLVKQVSIDLAVETYGRQRMTKIAAIRVVPRTAGLEPWPADLAA